MGFTDASLRTHLIGACLFLLSATAVQAQVTFTDAAGSLESAYAMWTDDGSDSYNVYYSGNGSTDEKVDAELVRKYGSTWRVDVPGLKAGSYTLKVAGVKGGKEGTSTTSKSLTVKAHDRSGFAFSNSHVPGAYKKDGTLKDGAIVLYITESTKNTVSLDVVTSSKGATTSYTGLQAILDGFKKGIDTRPLDIRLIGNITDPAELNNGDIVIDHNKKEGLSITLEGIGMDATVNGWGIRVKGAQDVEIRNLGIMNVDSEEDDNIGLQQDNKYVWVHNCDFFYGEAGSDADQKKGDGALDCKKSTYVTFSYNHFWDNGKSNLAGLSEGTTEGLYITFHHNWYDHSDSRHPRVRYYSAHVYNNYYDGNAKYGAGSTLGSSVFMEANYFRNCKYPMLTAMQGSDVYEGNTTRSTGKGTFSGEDGGSIKAYNNHMEGTYTFIPYGASKYIQKGKETSSGSINTQADFDAYVVESRNTKVPTTVKSYKGANTYNNFDTDNSLMYSYTADTPEQAVENIRAYAGRVQGGDFRWTFDNSTDDASSSVNQALKDALTAYKGWDGTAPQSSSSKQQSSSSTAPSSSSAQPTSSTSEPSSSQASIESSSASKATPSSSSEQKQGIVIGQRLEISGQEMFRINVFSITGKKVLTSYGNVIDLSSLPSGNYIVQLNGATRSSLQKIYVQRTTF